MNVVSPERGLGGERRLSRQEAGHPGAGRRTLSKLASSMTYVTICQPPWRYTGTTKGMRSPAAMRPSVRHRDGQLTCESAGQADTRLVDFGPRYTSPLI
jgi:hypothetical protein